ncbi:hypothetical protein [Ensifer sp.]|uniref:hypothetical protein n=1 Tax=Ensifer sp. TaxID=1872086 RepID=UPI002E0D5994|nr:hypothetical protein [Ensifer sp.]
MTSTSCVRIAALLSLSLLVHTGAAAQAYVDQVNRGVGNGAYVEQMPAGAKPATQKQTSPNKTKPYSQSSRSAKPGKASAAQAAGADIVPTVGTGSSAVVTLSAGELEWPTVGRGTVNR